jgi:gamma-glutamylcyclotransferase (GGCT)/AIG2-like uncharacterized protein YtfP
VLYFAYTARIEPSKMTEAAPGATFEFIAYIAEWSLEFPIAGNGWNGGLPSIRPGEGDTVWGAVFSVPDPQMASVDAIEAEEQRRRDEVEAIDRMGKRHQVAIHRAVDDRARSLQPASDYVALMLAGSRHWELPAGWIVRLEDHADLA